MRKLLVVSGEILSTIILCLSLTTAQAETTKQPDKATFSEAELDQMMAPIALYPDSLLAQILMASTYPVDVAEAVKWAETNTELKGDDAVKAVNEKSWAPSVMSLVAFPQVLTMMGEQAEWVQKLGDAFLANSESVMNAVQKLRKKAKEEGNLETTKEQKVTEEEVVKEGTSTKETVVIIEPADPEIVYVPSYNPTVVYGTWWWPHYTPWYYHPYGYGFGAPIMRGIGFGVGVGITASLWGGCSWGRGDVDIDISKHNELNVGDNKLDGGRENRGDRSRDGSGRDGRGSDRSGSGDRSGWKHNSDNRRGVPYKDSKTREQFSNKKSGASSRENFRGRDSQRMSARNTLDKRGANPAEGRKNLQGAGGDKARSSVSQANRDYGQGNFGQSRSSLNRNAGRSNSFSGSRNNALRGSGNASRSRQSIDRGRSSNRSMSGRSMGGRSMGGGRRGGGGRR